MIILGLLAILQMLYLPGSLVLCLLPRRFGAAERLLYIFGISLLVNHFLVLLLVTLGIYTQAVLIALAVLEIAALLYLKRHIWQRTFGKGLNAAGGKIATWFAGINAYLREWQDSDAGDRALDVIRWGIFSVLLLMGISAVVWIFRVMLAYTGSVFNSWDAVLSWNSWALIWAGGNIPQSTQYYPQLLPANWSLTYVMIGSLQVQLFAKAVMPLFTLVIFIGLIDLAFTYRSYAPLLALVAARYMLKKFVGDFIPEGYADIPTAALSFLALYALLKSRTLSEGKEVKYTILLASLLAAGAALTKSAGLFTLIVLPLLIWHLVKLNPLIQRNMVKINLKVYLVFGLLPALSWYVVKVVGISSGLDDSNVGYLTQGIHLLASPLERILPALLSLEKYVLVVLLAACALVISNPFMRLMAGAVLIYSLIWAAYFSYDVRNLAFIIPWLCLAAGTFLERVIEWVMERLKTPLLARLRLYWLIVLIVLFAVLLAYRLPTEQIVSSQIEQQKQIFNPDLNQKLYAYHDAWQGTDPLLVLTNYPLNHLPGLEGTQFIFYFNDFSGYRAAIENPAINHLLVPSHISDNETHEHIQNSLHTGDFEVIFEEEGFGGFVFIRIR